MEMHDVKATFAYKTDNLISILGLHMIGENQLLDVL